MTDGTSYDAILEDDEALGEYLRATVTGYLARERHLPDGRSARSSAVTDGAGRVIGVERLRVCDASIMPTIPCANPNVPVMMMAERISDLILNEA